ncbi:MAG: fluoride efflux transporter CrcB [Pseudomonadales bacterium]
MKHLLMIAAGGAAGALCRHWLVNLINTFSHSRVPMGTLSVNIIGSFCIGIMYVLITERIVLHPDWRNVAIVGFLGAFTTFSTFSLEAITLLENGQMTNAALYISSSLILCVLAAWLAISLTRLV